MEGLLQHSYSSTLNFLKGRGQHANSNGKNKKISKPTKTERTEQQRHAHYEQTQSAKSTPQSPKTSHSNMLTRWLRDLRGSSMLRSSSNLEDNQQLKRETLNAKYKHVNVQISRSQSTLVAHKPTRKKTGDNRRYSFNDHALQNQKRHLTRNPQCNGYGYESKRKTFYADSIMMPSRSTPNLQQETQSSPPKLYRSTSRDQTESPPPAPPVRDSSTLKSVKYGPGHEKFPSWPVPAAAETPQALRQPPSGGSHRSKSWTDHTNYPKEQVVTYTRPYMKRQHSQTQQKLKTVMERCEKMNTNSSDSSASYERRLYLPHVDRDGKQLGDADYVVPSPPERDTCKPQLTQADLEQYAHLYQQESTPDNKYQGSGSGPGQTELESFIKYSLYPHNNVQGQEGILMHLQHQKQLSYAQSEGYHSYVSSADSTSTPFLDRLRRDSDAVPGRWSDDDNRREGRDSVVTTSSGSASSSETLKWHGSMSDVSIASSCTHLASNKQLIAHSARVQTPQRHHSESVLFMSSGANEVEGWKHKESRKNSANKLKLFPVNTYTVKEDSPSNNRLSDSLTVADRINELEKQQKYSYLDPDKKHKIPDPTLKAIQKKALLSFYERHQSNKTNWRSEPQLTASIVSVAPATTNNNTKPNQQQQTQKQTQSQAQRTTTQLPSRRASSASDYAANNASKRNSMAPKHQHSNSYGSLTTDLLGPIIVGPSISLDDWVPERPPKNPHLRTAYPDLFREQRIPSPDLPPPPPPPTSNEFEVLENDDPLPPPPSSLDLEAAGYELIKDQSNKIQNGAELNETNVFIMNKQQPAPQVAIMAACTNYVNEDDMKKHTVGLPECGKKSAREQLGITTVTRSPSKRLIGSVAVNQKVGGCKPMRAEPLFEKKPVVKLQQRASFAESSSKDLPPPLQPRQMRVNQSMRAKMSDHRPKAVALRISPSTESQKQQMMKPSSPGSPNYHKSQSKASYLASRRERERIVPDSDTGSYKRTISPNGHAISDYQQSHSVKQCPKETILKKNNNNVNNIVRRASMNDKSMKMDDTKEKKHAIILPDVLPVNVKMMAPCYLSLPPVSNESNENGLHGTKKSPSPPSTPNKAAYNSLRCTLISTPPFVQTPPTPPESPRFVTRPVLTAVNVDRIRTPHRTPGSPGSPRSPPSPRSPSVASRTSPNSSLPVLPSLPFVLSQSPVKASPSPLAPGSPISPSPELGETLETFTNALADGSKDIEKLLEEDGIVVPVVPVVPQRKKLQEEIDCERLSEDFVNQLPTSIKLKEILVQGPDYKKPQDYVNGLFKLEITSRPRPANSPFSRSRTHTPSSSPPPSTVPTMLTTCESPLRLEPVSPLSATSPYFTTSEPKARLLTRYSRDMNHLNIVKDTKDLSQKKDELISRLDRKLEVLRSEQLDLIEECRINEELGHNVEEHVQSLARPHEASKFRLHVEEVGKITSLLLSLSGRLARAENALMSTYEDYAERRILETKRNKLLDQLEEAKKLKECIDKRSLSVSTILNKYLSSEEYADYDHFINMKAKLLMDSKEIADKIKLGEEQLAALKETLIIGS